METIQAVDVIRREELGVHAALLLTLNHKEIPRPNTSVNVIKAAVSNGLLEIDPDLRKDIGM
ncbi:hypothetical protein BH09PAT4_BH09PAT4_06050 [soil metagenome]